MFRFAPTLIGFLLLAVRPASSSPVGDTPQPQVVVQTQEATPVVANVAGVVANDAGAAVPRVTAAEESARRELDVKYAGNMISYLASAEGRVLPEAFVDQIARLMVESGRRHGIDPIHIVAIAWHESRFRNELRSPAGACGIVQVMPREVLRGRPTCAQLRDPAVAIEWSAKELDSLELDVAAYAGGRGGRNREGAVRYGYRHMLTVERLRRAFGRWPSELQQSGSPTASNTP
jgi:soluble lytic murein transglycosylase-like protein